MAFPKTSSLRSSSPPFESPSCCTILLSNKSSKGSFWGPWRSSPLSVAPSTLLVLSFSTSPSFLIGLSTVFSSCFDITSASASSHFKSTTSSRASSLSTLSGSEDLMVSLNFSMGASLVSSTFPLISHDVGSLLVPLSDSEASFSKSLSSSISFTFFTLLRSTR